MEDDWVCGLATEMVASQQRWLFFKGWITPHIKYFLFSNPVSSVIVNRRLGVAHKIHPGAGVVRACVRACVCRSV